MLFLRCRNMRKPLWNSKYFCSCSINVRSNFCNIFYDEYPVNFACVAFPDRAYVSYCCRGACTCFAR